MHRARFIALLVSPLMLQAPLEVAAQSFPRMPRVEQPKLPNLPNVGRSSISTNRGNAVDSNMVQAFITDAQKLSTPINTTTVNDADNSRIDREVASYRKLADRLSGGRYDALPAAQREPMLFGLKTLYDGAAASVDDEIAFAKSLITGRGRADSAYNYLIANDAYLYAAERLFPSERSYTAARQKLAAALSSLGGSRDGARQAEDAADLAAARNVRMPASIDRDPQAQAMFKQAWQTSGIDWEIIKINVTSGWRDKVENGRVIGQRRDAAIAARDPNNSNRCNLYDFTMFRDRSGSVRRDSHSTTRIACENVK